MVYLCVCVCDACVFMEAIAHIVEHILLIRDDNFSRSKLTTETREKIFQNASFGFSSYTYFL